MELYCQPRRDFFLGYGYPASEFRSTFCRTPVVLSCIISSLCSSCFFMYWLVDKCSPSRNVAQIRGHHDYYSSPLLALSATATQYLVAHPLLQLYCEVLPVLAYHSHFTEKLDYEYMWNLLTSAPASTLFYRRGLKNKRVLVLPSSFFNLCRSPVSTISQRYHFWTVSRTRAVRPNK